MIYETGRTKNGLPGYRVRVHYTDENGVPRELNKTVYGMKKAKQIEKELISKTVQKDISYLDKITVNQLYEEYMTSRQPEIHESTYKKSTQILNTHVLNELGHYLLDQLNVRVLQRWKNSINKKQLSIVTKQNIYGEFRAMINFAIRMEYLQSNPLTKIGNFKEPPQKKKGPLFYTPDEFKKFINTAKLHAINSEQKNNNTVEWNYYVFFMLAFYTGCRKGELYGLRWSSLNDDKLSITCSVNQKLRKDIDVETAPKNVSSIRELRIPKTLIKVLEEHKSRQQKIGNFSRSNRILGGTTCIRDTTLQNKNKLYSKEAGVKTIRIHGYRHSHASLLINSGVNIMDVAKRLGHHDIETTSKIYSHLFPETEEQTMKILNSELLDLT